MADAETDKEQAELEVILQTALEIGMRVQLAGGYTARIHAAMTRVAMAMGADRAEPAITSVLVGLTVHRDGRSHTAITNAPSMGVNFSELTELSRLSKRAASMTNDQVIAELDAIEKRQKRYPPVLMLPMLGISCAAFAALFGADPGGIALACLGGFFGAAVRYVMTKRYFRPFVVCLAAAFVSAAVVLILQAHTSTLDHALAACVLYLVPGVPMLNGTADMITGFYLNGVVRLTMSTVIILGSAIGLVMAMNLWGVV